MSNSPEMTNPESDGARWLKLIGLGDLIGQPTEYQIDGETVMAEDFNQLCDDHVRPRFMALERIGTDDPRFDSFAKALREGVWKFMPEAEVTE